VQHPAHVEDATAALAWTLKNIERYGGDPSRLYISGHSAGAYLAALIFMDKSRLEKHGLSPDQIRANLSISPFLYVEETAQSRPKTVWGTKPEDWRRASVSPHITPGIGPTLLLYGEHDADWRKDQIERFGQAMRQLGNTVRVVEIPARNHLTLITDMDQAEEAVGKMLEDFIKSLK
jgi:acetyl esterase/lipase